MKFNVIILCQGQQSRLPELDRAKQLLPLHACGGTQILHRTIVQLSRMPHDECSVKVVCDERISMHDRSTHDSWRRPPKLVADALYRPGFDVTTTSLTDPGNSSLKGLARYCAGQEHQLRQRRFDATVVLLGDVVYSWACLEHLFLMTRHGSRYWQMLFAGSSHLNVGGGELWGVSWTQNIDKQMYQAMLRAMDKHPPAQVDKVYQPGQMRRLLFEIDAGNQWSPGKPVADRWWFQAVDDYTTDVDTPKDLAALPEASERASMDDLDHGLTW